MINIAPISWKDLNCFNMNYSDWLLNITLNYNGSKCKLSQSYRLLGGVFGLRPACLPRIWLQALRHSQATFPSISHWQSITQLHKIMVLWFHCLQEMLSDITGLHHFTFPSGSVNVTRTESWYFTNNRQEKKKRVHTTINCG